MSQPLPTLPPPGTPPAVLLEGENAGAPPQWAYARVTGILDAAYAWDPANTDIHRVREAHHIDYFVTTLPFHIGRSIDPAAGVTEDNALIVNSSRVSKLTASVSWEAREGAFVLECFGRNGMDVDGAKVECGETVRLRSGSRLRAGPCYLTFLLPLAGGPGVYDPARPGGVVLGSSSSSSSGGSAAVPPVAPPASHAATSVGDGAGGGAGSGVNRLPRPYDELLAETLASAGYGPGSYVMPAELIARLRDLLPAARNSEDRTLRRGLYTAAGRAGYRTEVPPSEVGAAITAAWDASPYRVANGLPTSKQVRYWWQITAGGGGGGGGSGGGAGEVGDMDDDAVLLEVGPSVFADSPSR